MTSRRVSLTFYGHACFGLTSGGTSILIDPFLAPNNPVAIHTAADVNPTHVVLTHGHADHVADALTVCSKSKANAYALVEIAEWLTKQGVPATDINLGGRVEIDNGTIGFVPALHTNTLPDGTVIGQAAGAVIHLASECIYHTGDTALFSDMKLIGEMEEVTTLIVPIGGRYTMDIRAAAMATRFIKPQRVIPCHYNTFPAIRADPQDFVKLVRELGDTDVTVMEPGDTIEL